MDAVKTSSTTSFSGIRFLVSCHAAIALYETNAPFLGLKIFMPSKPGSWNSRLHPGLVSPSTVA